MNVYYAHSIIGTLFLGVIIGSFLNVVIYRLPRGLSLSNPKRSFCPACRCSLPWYENIPILSWIILRGRCSQCRASISFQYPLVEGTTAFLFWLCFTTFPLPLAAIYALFACLLVVATVIDLQHWIIPDEITLGGIAAGVVASTIVPQLMGTTSHATAFLFSLLTAAAGYGLLWGILELGKMAFGRKRTLFPEPLLLQVLRSEENKSLLLQLGEEMIPLEELLLRPSDHITAHACWIEVAGERYTDQQLWLQGNEIRSEGHSWQLEEALPFQAEISEVTLPREAMGFGDVKFLGCIGAFLGWKGMLAALFGGSVFGSIVALFLLLVTRGRIGRSIPFGPALALAALLWIFRLTF